MADGIFWLKIIFILALWNTNICHTYAQCDASWIYGDNLRIQYSSKQHPSTLGWDDTINFSCDEGYRLRGSSSLKCLGSMGSLERNGMMAYCEKIQCFKYSPEKTMHVSPDLETYDYNQTINFYCDENQIVYGPTSARCTGNGWEYDGPSVPACGNKDCYVGSFQRFPMFITPEIAGDRVDVGTRIYLHCHEGYFLRCAGSLLCLESGRMEGLGMMCQCDPNHNSSQVVET